MPVWREFLFDTETAVTAYHKLPLGELSPHMSLVMLDEAAQDIEQVQQLFDS